MPIPLAGSPSASHCSTRAQGSSEPHCSTSRTTSRRPSASTSARSPPQQPDGIAQARDIRVQRIVPPIPSAAESTGPEEAARIAGAFPGHVRPLYALAATDTYACTPAEHALMRLTASCREAGVPWGGGLACGGGSLIEPCARGPRMSRMRRARSERIDQLIAAIRSRRAVNDMIDGPASGILLAPCPLPAPLYPLATNFYERHCP